MGPLWVLRGPPKVKFMWKSILLIWAVALLRSLIVSSWNLSYSFDWRAIKTLRNVQGHQGHCCFSAILLVFMNFSYSFHMRLLETPRNVLWGHTQIINMAEFSFFALKVKYWPFKVKPWNRHLTTLMTSDHHHIQFGMVGGYRQGLHSPMNPRS